AAVLIRARACAARRRARDATRPPNFSWTAFPAGAIECGHSLYRAGSLARARPRPGGLPCSASRFSTLSLCGGIVRSCGAMIDDFVLNFCNEGVERLAHQRRAALLAHH